MSLCPCEFEVNVTQMQYAGTLFLNEVVHPTGLCTSTIKLDHQPRSDICEMTQQGVHETPN